MKFWDLETFEMIGSARREVVKLNLLELDFIHTQRMSKAACKQGPLKLKRG